MRKVDPSVLEKQKQHMFRRLSLLSISDPSPLASFAAIPATLVSQPETDEPWAAQISVFFRSDVPNVTREQLRVALSKAAGSSFFGVDKNDPIDKDRLAINLKGPLTHDLVRAALVTLHQHDAIHPIDVARALIAIGVEPPIGYTSYVDKIIDRSVVTGRTWRAPETVAKL